MLATTQRWPQWKKGPPVDAPAMLLPVCLPNVSSIGTTIVSEPLKAREFELGADLG